MGEKDWIEILVSVVGSSGIWAAIQGVRMARIKKRTLKALLEDDAYELRRLRTLHSAIAGPPKTIDDCHNTIDLLLQLGAEAHGRWHGSKDPLDQLWRLKK